MEHIAAFMLLIGCNAGTVSCQELPAPQVAFESMEECVGALPVALGGAGATGRIVHARCAAIDPAWVEEDIEITWRMSREKGLEIDIREAAPQADGMLVAENAHPAGSAARLH
nr:hypothetical protein [uncultured Shinella sp.]